MHPKVYNFLWYLEARAIQRARQHQNATGVFFPGSHRLWRRKLFSNVRARVRNFQQDFDKRLKAAEQRITNEDVRAPSEGPSASVQPADRNSDERFDNPKPSYQEAQHGGPPAKDFEMRSRRQLEEIQQRPSHSHNRDCKMASHTLRYD